MTTWTAPTGVSIVTGSLGNNRSSVGDGCNTGGVGDRGDTGSVGDGGSVHSGVGVGVVGKGVVDCGVVGNGSLDGGVDGGGSNVLDGNVGGLFNDALHSCVVHRRDNGGGSIAIGVGVVVEGVVEEGRVSFGFSISCGGSIGCGEESDLMNKQKLKFLYKIVLKIMETGRKNEIQNFFDKIDVNSLLKIISILRINIKTLRIKVCCIKQHRIKENWCLKRKE